MTKVTKVRTKADVDRTSNTNTEPFISTHMTSINTKKVSGWAIENVWNNSFPETVVVYC
jgi:hypothetical protein